MPEMKEIVVISGKGGTGKTSVSAAFASIAAGTAVLADCDVDAANLYIVTSPHILRKTAFVSGREAVIRSEKCTSCGRCAELCRFDAIKPGTPSYKVDSFSCEGCGLCVRECPAGAVEFPERHCGEYYVSESRFGPMAHAKLKAASENSGKLVSVVRKEAKRLAEEQSLPLIITDGPPGTGCPVIASMGGADAALIVTEPGTSAEHDMLRILELVRHFRIKAFVCINRYDINQEITRRIEKNILEKGAVLAGRIPFSETFAEAQRQRRTVMETGDEEFKSNIGKIWEKISTEL